MQLFLIFNGQNSQYRTKIHDLKNWKIFQNHHLSKLSNCFKPILTEKNCNLKLCLKVLKDFFQFFPNWMILFKVARTMFRMQLKQVLCEHPIPWNVEPFDWRMLLNNEKLWNSCSKLVQPILNKDIWCPYFYLF